MEEGYEHSEENDFADLDEWLCEYVDGTIDPIVREALEEYMQLNPALASHVESLMETRYLLCNFGCKHKAPSQLQPLLRYRLQNEIVEESEPWLSKYNVPLVTMAAISSIAAMLLIIASTTGTASVNTMSFPRLGASQIVASQNIQVPVWQASPVDKLYESPLYSFFARQELSVVPAELRLSTTVVRNATADSMHSVFLTNDLAP